MAEMGKYCKAHYAKDFRALDAWEENLENLRPDSQEDGREIPRTELKDDDILYLQENYVVTDGIFKDEHVIFDKVTDAWKKACHTQLGFQIPVDEPMESKAAEDEVESTPETEEVAGVDAATETVN